MQTVGVRGRRLAAGNITGDEDREPDPVLWWRPVARKPFNSQRFKGRLAESAQAARCGAGHVLRRLAHRRPAQGRVAHLAQWPLEPRPPVPGRRVEVINAGVAGYSSYQGLLRFLQEVTGTSPTCSWSPLAGTTPPRQSASPIDVSIPLRAGDRLPAGS